MKTKVELNFILLCLFNVLILYQVIFSDMDGTSFVVIFFFEILFSTIFNFIKILKKNPERIVINNSISACLFVVVVTIATMFLVDKSSPEQGIFDLIKTNALFLSILIIMNIISLIHFFIDKENFQLEKIKNIFYYGFTKIALLVIAVYIAGGLMFEYGSKAVMIFLISAKIIADFFFK